MMDASSTLMDGGLVVYRLGNTGSLGWLMFVPLALIAYVGLCLEQAARNWRERRFK